MDESQTPKKVSAQEFATLATSARSSNSRSTARRRHLTLTVATRRLAQLSLTLRRSERSRTTHGRTEYASTFEPDATERFSSRSRTRTRSCTSSPPPPPPRSPAPPRRSPPVPGLSSSPAPLLRGAPRRPRAPRRPQGEPRRVSSSRRTCSSASVARRPYANSLVSRGGSGRFWTRLSSGCRGPGQDAPGVRPGSCPKAAREQVQAAGHADDWYRRAELAMSKGDEELAREALERRKSYQENADSCS